MKEKLANIYREEKFIFLVLEIKLRIGMYSIIVMGFNGSAYIYIYIYGFMCKRDASISRLRARIRGSF